MSFMHLACLRLTEGYKDLLPLHTVTGSLITSAPSYSMEANMSQLVNQLVWQKSYF